MDRECFCVFLAVMRIGAILDSFSATVSRDKESWCTEMRARSLALGVGVSSTATAHLSFPMAVAMKATSKMVSATATVR